MTDTVHKGGKLMSDNSIKALDSRAAARQAIPFRSLKVEMVVYKSASRKNTVFARDLTPLAKMYPHHRRLLRHLLIGTDLAMATMIATTPPDVTNVSCRVDAIHHYITFLNDTSWVYVAPVTSIADISVDHALSFSKWLDVRYQGTITSNRSYNYWKTSVEHLRQAYSDHPDIGRPTPWPVGPSKTSQPLKSYPMDVLNTLKDLCKRDIEETKALHRRFLELRASGEQILAQEVNLENIAWWLKNLAPESQSHQISGLMKDKKVSAFLEREGMSARELQGIVRVHGDELAARGRDPYGTRIPDRRDLSPVERHSLHEMAVTTLANQFPDFPFFMSLQDASAFLKWQLVYARTLCRDPERKLWSAFAQTGGCNTYFPYIHFTADTLYPFYLLTLINSGWNPESVEAIPDNFDDAGYLANIPADFDVQGQHTFSSDRRQTVVEPYLFHPNHMKMLASIKVRGQGTTTYHRTSSTDPYGMYSLMSYIRDHIALYRDSPHYVHGQLWQYIRHDKTWMQHDGVIGVYNNDTASYTSAAFVKKHGLKDCLGSNTIAHNRIRVTRTTANLLFEYARMDTSPKISGLSPEEKASINLQDDPATTTIHYVSGGIARIAKNRALAPVQETFVHTFTSKGPTLVLSANLSELRDAIRNVRNAATSKEIGAIADKIGLDEQSVEYILSPDGTTYILMCRNPMEPTWTGREHFVPPGAKCFYFNRCCRCKQAVVFRDNLPYIARRILDIEEMHGPSGLNPGEWAPAFIEEYQAWQEILDLWESVEEDVVEDAWRQARAGTIVLPRLLQGPRGRGIKGRE